MFATDMYNQRSRLNDLLDAVRAEYEQLAQEAGLVKSQRDECELASKAYFYAPKRGGGVEGSKHQENSEQPNPGNILISANLPRIGTLSNDAKETVSDDGVTRWE